MERLVELLAMVLIRKGVDAAIAWALASEQAANVMAGPGMGGTCGPDPLAQCRVDGRSDLEDECYVWDLPVRRF